MLCRNFILISTCEKSEKKGITVFSFLRFHHKLFNKTKLNALGTWKAEIENFINNTDTECDTDYM